jgi:outer membrane usher protein
MEPSVRRCRRDHRGDFVTLVLVSSLMSAPAAAQLAPIDANQAILTAPRALRLDVFINGAPTHILEPFTWTPPGRLSATRGDLEDIGVKAPGQGGLKDVVFLDELPGIKFAFDEAAQKVDFTLTDSQRLAHVYDARGEIAKPPPTTPSWGALVNYTLYGSLARAAPDAGMFSGANVTLDARAFSPFGVLSQTGIVGDTIANDQKYLRLDSTFTYSDPDDMLTARAGDSISGGLAWTRPIRFGGLQLQRDFTMRSDLVTQPTPAISGSAAVPSSVDVFIDSVKAFSQNVGAGPYQINNLPLLSSGGAARVVVTDASGRQTQSSVSLYNSPHLLAKGLLDFSLDAGFARQFYASASDAYGRDPIGSATLRAGIFDNLTLEAHGEGGDGLANGGFGALASFGPFGVFSLAGAASHFGGDMGYQVYGAYDLQFKGLALNLSTQHTFGAYNDLASVTATQAQAGAAGIAANFGIGLPSTAAAWDAQAPKGLDRISLSAPLPFDRTNASVSFIALQQTNNTRSQILAASLTKQLPQWNASLFATAYIDLAQRGSAGLFAGLTITLGDSISASAGVSGSAGSGFQPTLDAQKALQSQDGDYGWRVHDAEGGAPYRTADASYRSGYGTVDAGIQQQNGSIGGTAQFDGSIAAVSAGIVAGNRIQDSFAVVAAGAPGIGVLQDNREIGTTNPWGLYLVPNLRAYQTNRIGIDPAALPINAEASSTQKVVAPARNSGVALDFGINRDVRGAIVVLTGADGKFLPPGSKGRLAGSQETFLIGYDGQAYVKGLGPSNTIVAENGEAECQASFAYAPAAGARPVIGPLPCR